MNRLCSELHSVFTSEILEILFSKQIFTVIDFVRADPEQISKICHLPFKDVLNCRKCLISQFSATPINALTEYKNAVENSAIISTGIKELDELLGGGLHTNNIYEICGLPASGKSFLCLKIMSSIAKDLDDKIYFLDTKHQFCGLKFRQLLEGIEKEKVLEVMERVLIQNISTKYELVKCLHAIKEKLQDGLKLRTIFIDSLPVLFFESSDHTENNSILNHIVNVMHYISTEFYVCIIIVNLITLWNEGDFKTKGQFNERIACGKYWYNIPNVRLKIAKQDDKFSVTLMKNVKPIDQLREVCFVIE